MVVREFIYLQGRSEVLRFMILEKNILSKPLIILFAILFFWHLSFSQSKPKSVEIENLTWIEAEKVIKEYEVVLIALGARTKEHGPIFF